MKFVAKIGSFSKVYIMAAIMAAGSFHNCLKLASTPKKTPKTWIIGDTALEVLSKYILRYYFMAALIAAPFWNIGFASIIPMWGLRSEI